MAEPKEKAVMKWHEALKQWNLHKKSINPAHVFALPKKGTPEHAEVRAIQYPVRKSIHELRAEMRAKKAAEAEAKKKAPKDEHAAVMKEIDEFLAEEEPKSKAEKKRERENRKLAAAARRNDRARSNAPLRARPGPVPGAAAAEKRSHRDEIIKILSEMWATK